MSEPDNNSLTNAARPEQNTFHSPCHVPEEEGHHRQPQGSQDQSQGPTRPLFRIYSPQTTIGDIKGTPTSTPLTSPVAKFSSRLHTRTWGIGWIWLLYLHAHDPPRPTPTTPLSVSRSEPKLTESVKEQKENSVTPQWFGQQHCDASYGISRTPSPQKPKVPQKFTSSTGGKVGSTAIQSVSFVSSVHYHIRWQHLLASPPPLKEKVISQLREW
mgnify:CR=1 FL=1